MLKPEKKFMEEAIRQAKQAQKDGDYAIGAVIECGDKIVAVSGTRSKRDQNPVSHAETIVLAQASRILNNRHLVGCVLYTTNEPCPMCASAIVWAKLKGVVYGARTEDMKNHRERNGSEEFLWRTIDIPCEEVFRKSTEKIEIVPDFMREECLKLFH